MTLKAELRMRYNMRVEYKSRWESKKKCMLDTLTDRRRFYAELIADSVVECLDDADKHPTVEVDDITSDEWVDNYKWLDHMVQWLCGY